MGTSTPSIDAARLAEVQKMNLSAGSHTRISKRMCVMEAVSFVAGEPWSDHPRCASPVIGAFLRKWNDSLPDDERTELLRDLVPLLVGTRSTPTVEQRRGTMAADWLIRTYTPAWLRFAGLTSQADKLVALPEITDFAQCNGLMPILRAVRSDAADVWVNFRDSATISATVSATSSASARDAVWDAVWETIWETVRDGVWDGVWDAIWFTSRDAIWAAVANPTSKAAAMDALKSIEAELQQPAKALVIRMCEYTAED